MNFLYKSETIVKKQIFISLATLFIFLFMFSYVSAIQLAPTLDERMVMYYKMNNDSSIGENETFLVDTVRPLSGNATIFNDTYYNASSSALGDGSFVFDGAGDYILPDAPAQTNFSEAITMMAWIKTNTTAGGKIFGSRQQYLIGTSGGYLQCNFNSLTDTFCQFLAPGITNNEWHHVAITYNGTDMVGYFDGEYLGKDDSTGEVTTVQPINIGRRSIDNDVYFNGSIDEVILFNASLSSSEIKDIYNAYVGECTIDLRNAPCNMTSSLNLTASQNLQINTSDYVIQINSNTLELDCKNSIITGNLSGNFYQVDNNVLTGHTLKNCDIRNYEVGAYVRQSDSFTSLNNTFRDNNYSIRFLTGANTFKVQDSFFYNTKSMGIWISNTQNWLINNTYFNNSDYQTQDQTGASADVKGFIFGDSTGSDGDVINNEFYSMKSAYIRLPAKNNYFANNYLEGIDAPIGSGTYKIVNGDGSNNQTWFNNTFVYAQYPVYLDEGSKGYNFTENIFKNSDTGSRVGGSNHIFFNNTFMNITQGYDGYNIGLKAINAQNLIISYNNFSEIVTGVSLQNVTGFISHDNSFDFINISDKGNYKAKDNGDLGAIYRATPLVRGWIGEGREGSNPDNITYIQEFISNNISIYNDSYDADVQVFLWLQGATNVTHDFSDYWYVSWENPYLTPRDEYFIRNSVNEVTAWTNLSQLNIAKYDSSGLQIESNILLSKYRFWSGSASVPQPQKVYILNKDYLYFENYNGLTNETHIYGYDNTSGLSNALIYYGNFSICGNSDLSANDGSLSCSIPNGTNLTVLNEFNLSEGSPRTNSPLGITKPTPGEVHITSTLAEGEDLDGVLIILNQDCGALTDVIYTSDSGTTDYRPDYTCEDNLLTLTVDGIEGNSLNSNVLYILEDQSSGGGGGSSTTPSEDFSEDLTDDDIVPQTVDDGNDEDTSILDTIKNFVTSKDNDEKKNNSLTYLFLAIGVIFLFILGTVGIVEAIRK